MIVPRGRNRAPSARRGGRRRCSRNGGPCSGRCGAGSRTCARSEVFAASSREVGIFGTRTCKKKGSCVFHVPSRTRYASESARSRALCRPGSGMDMNTAAEQIEKRRRACSVFSLSKEVWKKFRASRGGVFKFGPYIPTLSENKSRVLH